MKHDPENLSTSVAVVMASYVPAALAAESLSYSRNPPIRSLCMHTTWFVALNDTMWLMRTHFTGTWFDETTDVGAGPYHAEFRDGPSTWKSGGKLYTNERTVSEPYNAFHMVAHIRAEQPAPIGGVLWFGVDDQSLSAEEQ